MAGEQALCPTCVGAATELTPEYRNRLCADHRAAFMAELQREMAWIADHCCEFCGKELADCRCNEGNY